MAEDYESMTVAELKELLKEQGLPVSGKKADLIERLAGAVEEDDAPVEDVEASSDDAEEEDDFFEDDDDWDDDEDEGHVAKQKPVLDEATQEALALRAKTKEEDTFVPTNRMVPIQAIVSLWMACSSRYGQQATSQLQVPRFPCSCRTRQGCFCSWIAPIWFPRSHGPQSQRFGIHRSGNTSSSSWPNCRWTKA